MAARKECTAPLTSVSDRLGENPQGAMLKRHIMLCILHANVGHAFSSRGTNLRMQLQSIQALRALAALMVLASHLAQSEIRFLADSIAPLWLVAGASGVDLFFVISGVVMVYVTRTTPPADPKAIGAFLYARTTRIYPVYWLFTAVMLVAYAIVPGLTRSGAEFDVVNSLLLLPGEQTPVLVVAWTLVHEMYFYLAFAVLLIAPARWLPALLLCWITGVVAAQLGGLNDLNAWTRIAFHPLTAEFVLGAMVGLLIVSGRRRFSAAAVGLGVIWWIAASLWLAPYQAFDDTPTGWYRVLAWGAPAALIVYGVVGLELDHKLRPPSALVRVGDWSYALYLCHLPIVAMLSRVWASHGPDFGTWDNVMLLMLAAFASLLAAAAGHHLFERPVLSATRALGRQIFRDDQSARARTPADRIW